MAALLACAMPDAIVTFAIPLISRVAARDWAVVQHQLNATIGSIYNQTDPNFRIVIACSDLPELTVPTDERLTTIRCEPRRQINRDSFVSDSVGKTFEIARRQRGLGPCYFMFTDADDLVSNRLVEYIRADRNPNGYVVDRGYLFDAARGYLSPFPFNDDGPWRFDHECGTCNAVYFTPEELPDADGRAPPRFAAMMADGHPGRRIAAKAEGRPLAEFPFRAVVYVKNTGENVSVRRAHMLELERLDFQAQMEDGIVRHRLERTSALDAEFNLKAAEAPPSHTPASTADSVGLGLSVAIVTHKRHAGLRRLLAALRPQVEGRSDRELIVVNDGTHDAHYQAVVEDFADVVTYTALPENVGVAEARNRSVAVAAGEYVVFIDDDCVPPAWWLDWLTARLLEAPEADVIAGTTTPNWKRKGFFERVQAHYRMIPHPWMSGRSQIFVLACAAIRRRELLAAGGFGFPGFPGAGEDTELALRIARRGGRIKVDPHWSVLHDLDSLRVQARRHWRYGYTNVTLSDRPGAADFANLREARRLWHPTQAWDTLQGLWRSSRGFSSRCSMRLAATLAALPVRIAYLDGCAAAARALRLPRGSSPAAPKVTKAGV